MQPFSLKNESENRDYASVSVLGIVNSSEVSTLLRKKMREYRQKLGKNTPDDKAARADDLITFRVDQRAESHGTHFRVEIDASMMKFKPLLEHWLNEFRIMTNEAHTPSHLNGRTPEVIGEPPVLETVKKEHA
jgi:hypothetical protein